MNSSIAEYKQTVLINTLRGCKLFVGLAPTDLAGIAAITLPKTLAKGEYLFHEGESSRGFYIVQRGAPDTGTAGQTILEIAHANDIAIPTLCYMKNLSPWGGCRMCIVEIKGSPKVVPSCATPARRSPSVLRATCSWAVACSTGRRRAGA